MLLATRLRAAAHTKFKNARHAHIAESPLIQNTTFLVPVDSATHSHLVGDGGLYIALLTWDGDEYDGIVDWMGTNGGTVAFANPGDPGTVRDETFSIAYSSRFSASYSELFATDHLNVDYEYLSQNNSNSWWRVDFGGERAFQVTHYGIHGHGNNSYHLRSWKLQGSQDASAWTDLDVQSDNTSINNLTWFSAPISDTTAWRYLRILSTGLNSGNNFYLAIGEIDFWGGLVSTVRLILPDDAIHATSADQAVVADPVFVDEAAHAHSTENVTLDENLTVNPVHPVHQHAADSVTITQHHFFSPDPTEHAHSLGNVSLAHQVFPGDASHSHSADETSISQVHAIVVDESTHVSSSDNALITLPQVLYVGTAGGSGQNGGSIVVTLPQTTQANDLLVAGVVTRNATPAVPSGWSTAAGVTLTGSGSNEFGRIYYRFAPAGLTSVTFTRSDHGTDGQQVILGQYRNAAAFVEGSAVQNTHDAPSRNGESGGLLFCSWGTALDSGYSNVPGGMTLLGIRQGGANGAALMCGFEIRQSAGATGTRTAVQSGVTDFEYSGSAFFRASIRHPVVPGSVDHAHAADNVTVTHDTTPDVTAHESLHGHSVDNVTVTEVSNALLTESGDTLTTESGDILELE